jgi:hypothetical protein
MQQFRSRGVLDFNCIMPVFSGSELLLEMNTVKWAKYKKQTIKPRLFFFSISKKGVFVWYMLS